MINNFEVFYKEEDIDLSNLSHDKKDKLILNTYYRKEVFREVYNRLRESYSETYAMEVLEALQNNTISITNLNNFLYNDCKSYNSVVYFNNVAKVPRLKIKLAPSQNSINFYIYELCSYINTLYRLGYTNIELRDSIFSLALYYKQFKNHVSKAKVAMFKDTSFYSYLRILTNTLSLSLLDEEEQRTSICIMGKDIFEHEIDNLKLIDNDKILYTLDYETYKEFLVRYIDLISSIKFSKSILLPNLKYYAVQKSTNRHNFINYLAEVTKAEYEFVKTLFSKVPTIYLDSPDNFQLVDDCLKMAKDTPVRDIVYKELKNILEKEDILFIDDELISLIEFCRSKNYEIVYINEEDVVNVNRKILSETILDYNKLVSGKEDLVSFKKTLEDYYMAAQTVNYVKREINKSTDRTMYMCTKIINVPEELRYVVYSTLYTCTESLKNTLVDNFMFLVDFA